MLRYWLFLGVCASVSFLSHANVAYDALDLRLGVQSNQPASDYTPLEFSARVNKPLLKYVYLPAELRLETGEVDDFRESRFHVESGIGLRVGLLQGWDLNAEVGGWWRQYYHSAPSGYSNTFDRVGAWLSLGSRYQHSSGWELSAGATLHHDLEERGEVSLNSAFFYPLNPSWDASASMSYQPRNSALSDAGTTAAIGLRYHLGESR